MVLTDKAGFYLPPIADSDKNYIQDLMTEKRNSYIERMLKQWKYRILRVLESERYLN